MTEAEPLKLSEVLVDNQAETGLRCPKCHCRHLRVVRTEGQFDNANKRRRECRNCGFRFNTYERA